MEEMNPVLQGRCSTEKSDFKGVPDQIWWRQQCCCREAPKSQRRDLNEQGKPKTARKPWALCLTACTRLLEPSRSGQVQWGNSLSREEPESEASRRGSEHFASPLCSLARKSWAAWTRDCFQSTQKGLSSHNSSRFTSGATTESPAQRLPACSGSVCFSRSGGSRGSTRCSHPRGWSAWSRAGGSYHVSCACCNAESHPVY